MITKHIGLALAVATTFGCKTQKDVSSESLSTGTNPVPGRVCSASEDKKINADITSVGPLYQQSCLAYADKQGDINIGYLMQTTPLGLFARLMASVGKKLSAPEGASSGQNRWDPKFLNSFPFDINPVLPGSGEFKPNAGQKSQLTLPGYALAASLNKGKVIVGRNPTIEINRFMKLFAAVVQKTKIAPFIGEVHRFTVSPAELEKHVPSDASGLIGGQFIKLTRDEAFEFINNKSMSKLLTALAMGVTSRVLYTGGERAILEYLASKPENSVQFHELFEFAYRMHNGDMYLTILTIENTLSRWWRATNRDNLMTTRKLANITNSYLGSDDRYGAWYHFYGIALLGLIEGDIAKTIAEIESKGSHILNQADKNLEDESQEDSINSIGANFGVELGRVVREFSSLPEAERVAAIAKKYSVSGAGEMERALTPDNYLVLNEDFRDRLTMPLSSSLKVIGTDNEISITNTASDLSTCHIEIFPTSLHRKARDSNLLRHFSASLSTGKAQKYSIASWPANSVSLKGARVIVSGCLGQENNVLVADSAL